MPSIASVAVNVPLELLPDGVAASIQELADFRDDTLGEDLLAQDRSLFYNRIEVAVRA